VINDAAPRGNGDGILDPGESARIEVTLRNAGDAPATSVVGALYSAYPGLLKVYDGSASYPDMAVGAQGASASPHYDVTLEPGAACGQVLGATMAITGNGFDVGSAMTFDIGTYSKNYPSTDTPKSIPTTGSTGISSYISVPVTFPLTEVDATINIAHPDISALDVLLYRPATGTTPVYLHNNTDPGVSGIHTTYDDQTAPDGPGTMDDFIGSDPQGSWRLKITNSGSPGTLQNWTLRLKSNIPFNCKPIGCAQGVPTAVGDTLAVSRSGAADVRLNWSSVGSADYNVWRATDAQFTTAKFVGASGGATTLLDAGAQALPGMHYYLVRSVNSCRWESP
nr:proprotein convertase P-domain-containing protein [Acidobacteriota bacterium]